LIGNASGPDGVAIGNTSQATGFGGVATGLGCEGHKQNGPSVLANRQTPSGVKQRQSGFRLDVPMPQLTVGSLARASGLFSMAVGAEGYASATTVSPLAAAQW
jgi:hypothetical protein